MSEDFHCVMGAHIEPGEEITAAAISAAKKELSDDAGLVKEMEGMSLGHGHSHGHEHEHGHDHGDEEGSFCEENSLGNAEKDEQDSMLSTLGSF
jgi:hypothetical protein